MTGNTSHAVRAQRHEPPDSLDFFPTPPFATRALCETGIIEACHTNTVWDPCCGQGHMAEPLKEYFSTVYASDIFGYGYGEVADFLSEPGSPLNPTWAPPVDPDWLFFNPPFNKAAEFVEAALTRYPGAAVAMLIRTAGLEGKDRYERVFTHPDHQPNFVYVSTERIAMVKGRYDPKASTATSYSWVIWLPFPSRDTIIRWIPPGGKARLYRPEDALIGKDLT